MVTRLRFTAKSVTESEFMLGKLLEGVWKERPHSSLSREEHFQYQPEPRNEVCRNPQGERCRAVFSEEESTVGKRVRQSSALVRPATNLNRDVAPIGDDIEPMVDSRADVQTGNEERILRSKSPTVEMNPTNPMSRAEQEREGCGRVVYRNWCAACVETRGVGRHFQVEPLEEEERERTTPNGSF